jgi:multidrug efflux pump subunit AcrA (membrane-fusion protein)
MNPDTPRTEAARFEALRSSAFRQDCIPLKLGQELERELAASQAEVERLTGRMKEAEELIKRGHDGWQKAESERDEARKALILNLTTTGGMPWREWSAECAKETRRADENLERAEKAEAEVERLKKLCEMAIDSAEDALEERDVKRRIADEIRIIKLELSKIQLNE